MKTASTITIENDLWAELARVNLEVKDAIDSGDRDAVKKAVEKERRILAVLEKRWPRVDAGLAEYRELHRQGQNPRRRLSILLTLLSSEVLPAEPVLLEIVEALAEELRGVSTLHEVGISAARFTKACFRLQCDLSPRVRRALVQVVRFDFDGSALETLTMLARDNDADVRHSAVQALGDFYEDIDANNALFDRGFDTDRRVQRAAVTLLAEADDVRAVSFLSVGIGEFPPGACGKPEYRWRGREWASIIEQWSHRTGLTIEQAPLDSATPPDYIGLIKARKHEAGLGQKSGAVGMNVTTLRRAARPMSESLRQDPPPVSGLIGNLASRLFAPILLLLPASWKESWKSWGETVRACFATVSNFFTRGSIGKLFGKENMAPHGQQCADDAASDNGGLSPVRQVTPTRLSEIRARDGDSESP